MARFCENGNEHFAATKRGEFYGYFNNCRFVVCTTNFEFLSAVSAVTVVVMSVVGKHVTFRRNLLPPSSGKE
jgi:hypothetical protein